VDRPFKLYFVTDHLLSRFGGDGFRVDAMFEGFTVKEAAYLAGGDSRSFLGGLLAGTRDMGRHHDMRGFQ